MASKKSKKKIRPVPFVLRDVERAFIQAVMFQNGIIPMEKTTLDMRRALAQLPAEEARVLKRKFRKLWRKEMKKKVMLADGKTSVARSTIAKRELGVGKRAPSRDERNARKKLVFDALWEEVVAPMVDNFENITTTKDKESQDA